MHGCASLCAIEMHGRSMWSAKYASPFSTYWVLELGIGAGSVSVKTCSSAIVTASVTVLAATAKTGTANCIRQASQLIIKAQGSEASPFSFKAHNHMLEERQNAWAHHPVLSRHP